MKTMFKSLSKSNQKTYNFFGPVHEIEDKKKLNCLVDRISKRKEVEAIFLFGSRVNGRERKDSDYDLTVLTKSSSKGKDGEIKGFADDKKINYC